jgi:hypothetical protein
LSGKKRREKKEKESFFQVGFGLDLSWNHFDNMMSSFVSLLLVTRFR